MVHTSVKALQHVVTWEACEVFLEAMRGVDSILWHFMML